MKTITKLATAFVATAGLVLTSTPSFAADPVDLTVTGSRVSVEADGYLLGVQSTPTSSPRNDPYPASVPAGYVPYDGVASLYAGTIGGSTDPVLLYCVQILNGVSQSYTVVAQKDVNVENTGYVAWIVSNYYPVTALPDIGSGPQGGMVSNQLKASAVEAAIWYFTDGFVLAPSDPLYAPVAAIVAAARAHGPVDVSQPAPDLSFALNGPQGPFEPGSLAGPFTPAASASIARYTINAGGATMYGDAAGTTVIPADTAIPTDQKVWVKAGSAGTVTLTANASLDTAYSNFFMSVQPQSQTLVAAAQRHPVTATARAEFVAAPPATTPTPTATPTHGPELADTGSDLAPVAPFGALAVLLMLGGAATMTAVSASRRRAARAPR